MTITKISQVLLSLFLFACTGTYAQQLSGAFPQGHSHNDYLQAAPFTLAYKQQLGSIEADVFLRNDTLFVAHTFNEIERGRTFEKLYLAPLMQVAARNGGRIYQQKSLQLLVDLKTSGEPTLQALVRLLEPHKQLFGEGGAVTLVISGNTPAPEAFRQYPGYVLFDGRPEVSYTPEQLQRVGLISQAFGTYSKWNGKGIPVEADREKLRAVIQKAHADKKPFRFWASPDNINAWKVLMNLGADYINTDKVTGLGTFLNGRHNAEFKAQGFYEPYKPSYKNNDSKGTVKNIILLIGDGMGLAQIYAGLTGNAGKLNLANFLNIGFSKTASSDNYITDSAAGATAFATGKKTRNRAIGVDSNLVPARSIMRDFQFAGKKTALISSGDITDATPASFYAHRPERSMQDSIAKDYLTCQADILIGGGFAHFQRTGVVDSLRKSGVSVSDQWKDLASIRTPFVLLDEQNARPMSKGRGDFLSAAFKKSVQSFAGHKPGFFIMAEGAQIDYGGHANIVSYAVTEMLDFDQLVGEAMRFADSNGETLVIVTADHETGGLTLLDGNLRTGYVDGHFSTDDHTGIMVPVFAYGPRSLDFRGVYENTEIHQKLIRILKGR
ncbi:alkaline phosphatase [Dyadobacter sp. Leaf189]|uniref:alkaline phosphatase n=1 Tax=Dyadobacter sp. Leaf189 TaxID=1736295 RepID=UPI0006F3388B|nr:alkaline phosphatase [Dyadobacter sp. Leaf189]KQS28347.1 alkaline phosphatase [Dyadobacter sp. Leaf189]